MSANSVCIFGKPVAEGLRVEFRGLKIEAVIVLMHMVCKLQTATYWRFCNVGALPTYGSTVPTAVRGSRYSCCGEYMAC